MVASHTVVPLGTAKWLVWDYLLYNIACPWVGDMCCVCPLPSGKVFDMCCSHLTSHFAVPKGTAVWLATFVRCLTASVLVIGFPLSDAAGIILSILGIPNVILLYNVYFAF